MQLNEITPKVVILIELVFLTLRRFTYGIWFLKVFWVNSSVCITATNAPPKYAPPSQ